MDTAISATIVRHIEELEVAMRHIQSLLDPRLEREAGRILEAKRESLDWVGKIDEKLYPSCWLAPEGWRTKDDTEDNFDLYINFEGSECMDGAEPETWIAQFVGFGGSGMRFLFGTNALGQSKWKSLLRTAAVIPTLIDAGLLCDAQKGTLTLPVRIEKAALVSAFADSNFEEALAPISAELDRIVRLQPELNRLVAAVRESAP